MTEPLLKDIRRALRNHANAEIASHSQRFFKTGKGEYAEGDKFLGLRVPVLRKHVKLFQVASIETAAKLLESTYHEERLFALLLLVHQFERGDKVTRGRIYKLYLDSTAYINNWDLVDCSAPKIVGAWLESRKRTPLYKLARSRSLWERRIAVLATFHFIRLEDYTEVLELSERLLDDKEDLMHKACGWMLREVGNRDRDVLTDFLDQHVTEMPRTMLRYSIEKLPERQRKHYLTL